MEPFYPAYLFLGLAYQQVGRLSEAIAAHERANALSQRSTMTVAALGAALAAEGRASEALEVVGELEDGYAHGRYVSGVWLGAVHAVLGNTERAMVCLERARADGCPWLLRCLRLDPRLDGLRDFPRFQTLLDRNA